MPSSLIQKSLALRGILLAIILLAGAIIFSHYVLGNVALTLRLFISRLLFWLIVGILYMYARSVERQPFLMWKESNRRVVFYFVSIVAVLGCTLLGSVIIAIILKSLGLGNQSSIIKEITLLAIPVKLLAVFTAAFTEEFIIRGYLMPRLQLFFKSAVWPIIISSVIFGIAHIGFGTVLNMAIPLFIGLVFAIYYQKYRNLKVLIMCHFLIDFYALIVHH